MQQAQEELRDSNPLWQKALSLYEQTRTPLEQYQAKMAEITELFNLGFIDQELAFRSSKLAYDELMNSMDSPGTFGRSGRAVQAESFAQAGIGRAVQSGNAGGMTVRDPQLGTVIGLLQGIYNTLDWGIPARAM